MPLPLGPVVESSTPFTSVAGLTFGFSLVTSDAFLFRNVDRPNTALASSLDETGDNRLHTANRTAYAMPKTADPLAFLVALNFNLAAKQEAGDHLTLTGLPLPEKDGAEFITGDCMQFAEP